MSHQQGQDSRSRATHASTALISPYGGKLVNLVVPDEAKPGLREHANHMPSVQLSERSVCDLELLATGAFSPLDTFMSQEDHQSVLDQMRLGSGHISPVPVTLPVEPGPEIRLDRQVALRNSKNELLAIMTIHAVYEWDRNEVATKVCGTQDPRHPLVAEMTRWGELNISGTLQVLDLPQHYDFQDLRLTPAQTRIQLQAYGYQNIVAFQTRNPPLRTQAELIKRAIEGVRGMLLLHPVVGMTRPGDADHYTRVRTCKAFATEWCDPSRILLALLPLAMRLVGPREALWHAVIRRNYGANFLILGPDDASPRSSSKGEPFYDAYDAQDLTQRYAHELGVRVVPFRDLADLSEKSRDEEVLEVPSSTSTASISGTPVCGDYPNNGNMLPMWLARPSGAEILTESYSPRHRQGACIWFTGLSGAGKSTTAEVLAVLLQEHGRQVTVLDGDVVRTHLSKGLGFSKEDRDTNIRRIGFVAAEIVRHGGVVICAAVSPYRSSRNEVRGMVGDGHFVEVFVNTPLSICEARDLKGMYAKARRGELKGFTGVDDPYEAPEDPEIEIDTVNHQADDNARLVVSYLIERGFLRKEARGPASTA